VTESFLVQAGLTNANIIRVFTNTHNAMWYPITTFSFILDYELYGLNPKGYLLTNLFFHIANSLLLFLILFRMTGAIWQSTFVAAMFAFHPLNVESVAWVAERKNVLSTLFWLITMWAYIHYAEKPNIKRYSLVFLFFTLGLMSKPMLVTLPFVLLLLDYWPLRRLKFGQARGNNEVLEQNIAKKSEVLQLVFEKIPLFLLTTGFVLLTVSSAKKSVWVLFSILTTLNNVMISYFEYLWKMLWPKGLAILYAHPGNTLAVWKGVLCGIALLVITTISIKLIRKAPYFVVGWFWYLGTLIPVVGFIGVGPHLIADRYAYLPLIGIFVIIAWGVPELMAKWRYKKKVLSVSAGIIVVTLLITTWKQTSHWKNSITLYKHAIKVTDKKYPNFSLVHNNLGIALFADQKKEEAISHYKMAIKVKPNHTLAYYNLGIAMTVQQNNEEAISHYKKAIKLNPNFTNAHYNLGIILIQKGALKEAVYHFRETVRLRPDFVKAHDYLKFALLQSQRLK
jgi:lipoprotein NlpI